MFKPVPPHIVEYIIINRDVFFGQRPEVDFSELSLFKGSPKDVRSKLDNYCIRPVRATSPDFKLTGDDDDYYNFSWLQEMSSLVPESISDEEVASVTKNNPEIDSTEPVYSSEVCGLKIKLKKTVPKKKNVKSKQNSLAPGVVAMATQHIQQQPQEFTVPAPVGKRRIAHGSEKTILEFHPPLVSMNPHPGTGNLDSSSNQKSNLSSIQKSKSSSKSGVLKKIKRTLSKDMERRNSLNDTCTEPEESPEANGSEVAQETCLNTTKATLQDSKTYIRTVECLEINTENLLPPIKNKKRKISPNSELEMEPPKIRTPKQQMLQNLHGNNLYKLGVIAKQSS